MHIVVLECCFCAVKFNCVLRSTSNIYGLYYVLAYDIILVSTCVDLQEITIGCVKVHFAFTIPTTCTEKTQT
jgi:hypothetical protein